MFGCLDPPWVCWKYPDYCTCQVPISIDTWHTLWIVYIIYSTTKNEPKISCTLAVPVCKKKINIRRNFTQNAMGSKRQKDKATTAQCLSSFSKSSSCRDWSPIAFEIPILHSKYFFFRYNILQPQFEINANHPIMSKINSLGSTNPKLAMLVTEQLFANAMVSAGIPRHCNFSIWWNFSYAGSVIIKATENSNSKVGVYFCQSVLSGSN